VEKGEAVSPSSPGGCGKFDAETFRPLYAPVSPQQAAALAYDDYPEGSCMYAVVKAAVTLIAREEKALVPPVFFEMFKYGHGGTGGWGSLCGVCNGAAAVLGIFHREKKELDPLIGRFFRWYETTALPEYEPSEPTGTEKPPKSRAGSILCHLSTSMWCLEADEEADGKKRKERCRRLSADGAGKVIEILNAEYERDRHASAKPACPTSGKPLGPPDSCIRCHAESDGEVNAETMAPKAGVRMNCATCHDHDADHPEMYDKPAWMKR
jgi:hypothetical protein